MKKSVPRLLTLHPYTHHPPYAIPGAREHETRLARPCAITPKHVEATGQAARRGTLRSHDEAREFHRSLAREGCSQPPSSATSRRTWLASVSWSRVCRS